MATDGPKIIDSDMARGLTFGADRYFMQELKSDNYSSINYGKV